MQMRRSIGNVVVTQTDVLGLYVQLVGSFIVVSKNGEIRVSSTRKIFKIFMLGITTIKMFPFKANEFISKSFSVHV